MCHELVAVIERWLVGTNTCIYLVVSQVTCIHVAVTMRWLLNREISIQRFYCNMFNMPVVTKHGVCLQAQNMYWPIG